MITNKFTRDRARTQSNILNYFKESKAEEEAKQKAAQDKLNENFQRALNENIVSPEHQRKVHLNNIKRQAGYALHFRIIGLTEALTKVAVDALPVNPELYEQLNPNYKTEIHDTIRGLLESDSINKDLNNPDTKAIIETIDNNRPDADFYLTEDEEAKFIEKTIVNNVPAQLDRLSHNAEDSTVRLIAKDQELAAAQQNTIDTAKQTAQDIATNTMIANATPVEQPDPENPDLPIPDPDKADTTDVLNNAPDVPPTMDIQLDVSPEGTTPDTADVMVSKASVPGELLTTTSESVNFKMVKEQYPSGIIQTLAVNEGKKLLSENKEYNADLALANAIKFVTVLETMNVSGLMTIDKNTYKKIISEINSSNTINESAIKQNYDKALKNLEESKKAEETKKDFKEIFANAIKLSNINPSEAAIKPQLLNENTSNIINTPNKRKSESITESFNRILKQKLSK